MSARVNTDIQFGQGWNCCKEKPAKVVVFDNGARWAVCASCASMYTGEVQDLPAEIDTETTEPTERDLYTADMDEASRADVGDDAWVNEIMGLVLAEDIS